MKTKKASKTSEASPKILSQVYTIDYLIKNPSNSAKGFKYVWEAAVVDYMSKSGIDLSDKKNWQKPIENIDFAKIMTNFNKLMGKKKSKRKVS